MQQIAAAAGMSVGQIYRFFANKEAVIEAIVAQGVAEKIEHMTTIERLARDSGRDLAAVSAEVKTPLPPEEAREQAGLMLEILAEAARNPAVAAIVQQHDRLLQARAEQMVAMARPNWEADRVRNAVRMIAALHEGWYMRLIADPAAGEMHAQELRDAMIACALET